LVIGVSKKILFQGFLKMNACRVTKAVMTLAVLSASPVHAQSSGNAAPILPPVTVRADSEATYVVTETGVATRTSTPIDQIPQSIVVIPRKVIDDQGVQTMSDALRNVSNVTAIDPRDTNNTAFRIRGFSSATVIDGVSMPGYFQGMESLVNVQRIDVIKGPAGNLYGSAQGLGAFATLGGTIGITTSEPVAEPLRQLGFSLGSYGERSTTFDFNQPLSEGVGIRLVGEIGNSDSETDRVFFKKTALFPSISWAPSADTKVVLRLRHLENTTLDYSGLPPSGTVLAAGYVVPRNRIVTAEGLPDTTNKSDGANLQWSQRLSDFWTFGLTAAYNETEVDQRGVFPFPFGGVGPAHLLAGARLWNQWKTFTLSPNLTGKIDGGGAKHTLSLGLDYEKTSDDAFLAFSNGFGFLSFVPVDLRNPVYPAWAEPVAPAVPDQQNRYRSTVMYAQDQIDIGSWHFLAGLRYSQINVSDINVNPLTPVSNISNVSKWTPRFGAVYEFTSKVSAFAGYSSGIKVPTISVFSTPPNPEEAEQKEVGLRFKNLSGISASLAWFDLTRTNVAVPDPVLIGRSIQSGKQQSRGADLDLVWQANNSLRWILALSNQSAKIVEDTVLPVGSQLFNIPETTARLAARYDFRSGDLAGLGFGLGVTHQSELPGNTTNTFFTPASTVWDAQMSYALKKTQLSLAIRNLTDREYWIPSTYFGGGQVIPALPRTITATVKFDI
jgi:iron complex outermembrane receptor protein